MIKFFSFYNNKSPSSAIAAVLGNFDGFHLGHQAIINDLQKIASNDNLPAWLITFTPHPKIFFDADLKNFLLNDEKEKITLAKKFSLAGVAIIDFNENLANLSAENFVKNILIKKLSTETLLVGKNFLFGKNRSGDITTLSQHGIKKVIPFDLVKTSQDVVSSSLIRKKILMGDITAANGLLGRAFSITAPVLHGDQWGRRIGFPTANLDIYSLFATKKILPPFGIYAATAMVESYNKTYLAACYHGKRDALDHHQAQRLEVHLLDFNDDCYGKKITLHFHHFIRPDKKIDNLQKLKKQITTDIATIKNSLIIY
ncbi:MAG: riboflavin biosynthesis protein RibF [Alphaproteobacteria bacterium]